MTTTASSRENNRQQKGKRRSASDAASASAMEESHSNTFDHGSGNGGRSTKRVKDDADEVHEDRKPRSMKKGAKIVDESEMAVDEEGEVDEDGGETRCLCGKGDSDEGGLMVMCETCKVWQHAHCMELAEEDIPEHYYCELCEPSHHVELLKKLQKAHRRPRRRSSATRTIQKSSPSPSSPTTMTMAKAPNKRRNTMNSRATVYEEEMALAIQQSRLEAGEDDEEEDEALPTQMFPPRKRRKRSEVASVPEQDLQQPPPKDSRSASLTSEHPPPIQETTPNPEALDVPEQPAPEPSDEETNHNPPPPTTRGKRGGGPRKNTRRNATPSIMDDNDDAPTRVNNRGRQPNQYSRRGGHSGAKRGGGHHGAHDSSKRFNNANNKSTRPTSPPFFLTSWYLPDHLSHLASLLPSEIPEPLEVRISVKAPESAPAAPGTNSTSGMAQERGVKVKWPTKRMTMGDMNKRVRNMLDYVTREQANHAERKARMAALEEAIASGRYKPVTPDPDESTAMEVDGLVAGVDEDVKPLVNGDAVVPTTPIVEGRQMRPRNVPELDNETVRWMKGSTEEMLNDLVEGLLAFQDRYRPKARKHLTVGVAA